MKRYETSLETYHESLEQGMEDFITQLKTVIEVKQLDYGPNKGMWHLRLVLCLPEEVAESKTELA